MSNIQELKEQLASNQISGVAAIDKAYAIAMAESKGALGLNIINHYLKIVMAEYGVNPLSICGASRTKDVINARKALVYLSRRKGVQLIQLIPFVSPSSNRGTVDKLLILANVDIKSGKGIAEFIQRLK